MNFCSGIRDRGNVTAFDIRRLLLFCLLVMVGIFASAQIRGTVTDSLTHEPVPFVQVYYEGSTIGTQTDERGRYHLSSPSGGKSQKLVFQSIGYSPKHVWVKSNASRRA